MCSFSELWFFNPMKKCIFCNFVLTSARNFGLLKQFTYLHLNGLLMHFQKMVVFILPHYDCVYTMTYCLRDIRVWSWRIRFNFCRVRIFFDFLIANISWAVVQTLINHTMFWRSVMRTSRCIYINCFNRLRFLPEITTKL